jgi:hypothetical protein
VSQRIPMVPTTFATTSIVGSNVRDVESIVVRGPLSMVTRGLSRRNKRYLLKRRGECVNSVAGDPASG